MLEKLKKKTCPFCFEKFYYFQVPFRCENVPENCAPKVDDVLAEKWNIKYPVKKVINLPSKFYFKNKIECPICNHISSQRICPNCHKELPYNFEDFDNKIFSVIGDTNVGKSHYIAVLINEFRKKLGRDIDVLLRPLNDSVQNRYEKKFYNPLYKNKEIIKKTKSALSDKQTNTPLLFELSFQGKFFKTHIILAFFDTAGEDLNSEDKMSFINKYIYHSDGIILLLDPTELQNFENSTNILNRTTTLIIKGQELDTNGLINIPMAVTFTKFDIIFDELDVNSQLKYNPKYTNKFNKNEFEAINKEIEAFLMKFDRYDIINILKHKYKNYGFFGLSALGHNPIDGKVGEIKPHRIADPFLWLLYKNKLIREQK